MSQAKVLRQKNIWLRYSHLGTDVPVAPTGQEEA